LVTVRHYRVHQIQAILVASGPNDRLFGIHGFRLL
jgi:hypothetical protein